MFYMPTREQNIATYIGYFRKQAECVATVADPMFRQVLYATLLDPLARAAFGKPVKHRDNLQRLVEELTQWEARFRVSLPQLRLRLLEDKRSRFRLYREVSKRLKAWPSNYFPEASSSPLHAELLPFAAKADGIALDNSTYAALFCAHRNNLVHEFRPLGYGTDWSGRKSIAFYARSSFSPRELVFPVGLFAYLVEEALHGVEAHLRTSKIDPYTRFEFGSLWRFR
jgi:hypothetical protein